jgi:hypothetical protein
MYNIIFVLLCIYILYLGISFQIEIENLKRKNLEMLEQIIERDCLIKHLREHIENS